MPKRSQPYMTPAQVKAMVEDYRAGETVTSCCAKYGIARSTLYRQIRAFEQRYGASDKPLFFYQVELQRLKDVLAAVMMENADLKKKLCIRDEYRTFDDD